MTFDRAPTRAPPMPPHLSDPVAASLRRAFMNQQDLPELARIVGEEQQQEKDYKFALCYFQLWDQCPW